MLNFAWVLKVWQLQQLKTNQVVSTLKYRVSKSNQPEPTWKRHLELLFATMETAHAEPVLIPLVTAIQSVTSGTSTCTMPWVWVFHSVLLEFLVNLVILLSLVWTWRLQWLGTLPYTHQSQSCILPFLKAFFFWIKTCQQWDQLCEHFCKILGRFHFVSWFYDSVKFRTRKKLVSPN